MLIRWETESQLNVLRRSIPYFRYFWKLRYKCCQTHLCGSPTRPTPVHGPFPESWPTLRLPLLSVEGILRSFPHVIVHHSPPRKMRIPPVAGFFPFPASVFPNFPSTCRDPFVRPSFRNHFFYPPGLFPLPLPFLYSSAASLSPPSKLAVHTFVRTLILVSILL